MPVKAAWTIVVVGGGVFGTAAALELQRRRHCVILIDPGPLPHPLASSTDLSRAVRMDYGSDALYMSLAEEALLGWDRWNREWSEPLFHEDGMLFLTRHPIRPGDFEFESMRLLQEHGHPVERLDRQTIGTRFAAWAEGDFSEGYFNPRAGWVESGRVVERLVAGAREEGVEIREGVSMAALQTRGSQVTGVVTGNGEGISGDLVLVAAGPWTPVLLPHLREVMQPVAQAVFYFQPQAPDYFKSEHFPVWAADLSRTGWYGFPATAEGTVKVSNHGPGRRVDPDEPRRVLPEEEIRCRAFLQEQLPGLADAPLLKSRTCLYCDSWDGNFYIDYDPDHPGLAVAAGGSGHGFKFAPLLGRLIADILEGRPHSYAPRFAWRPCGMLTREQARSR